MIYRVPIVLYGSSCSRVDLSCNSLSFLLFSFAVRSLPLVGRALFLRNQVKERRNTGGSSPVHVKVHAVPPAISAVAFMTLVSNQDRVASSVFPSNLLDVYRKLRIGDSVGVQQSNSRSVPSTQRFVGDKYFPKSVPRSSDLAFRRWLTSTRVVVSASRGFSTPLGNALPCH